MSWDYKNNMPLRNGNAAEIRPVRPLMVEPAKAIAFVDYEYWYISMLPFRLKPSLHRWASDVRRRYGAAEIRFYGDFTQDVFKKELTAIREVSSQIIETKNISSYLRKDFTDFIMLDNIYQTLLFNNIFDTYIVFSGDGHFCPVVTCLRDQCKKNVVVYGIKNAFSAGLKRASSSWMEFPTENDIDFKYQEMILGNLEYVSQMTPRMYPTFSRTVNVVSDRYHADPELVKAALMRLLDEGYVIRRETYLGIGRTINALFPDWDRLQKDGLWHPGLCRELLPDDQFDALDAAFLK